jgi:hypothetical protein
LFEKINTTDITIGFGLFPDISFVGFDGAGATA